MPYPTHTTCRSCRTELRVVFYPSRTGSRIDPPEPASVDPADCPVCGEELDAAAIEEDERDAVQAARERAEEMRAEIMREAMT